MPSSYSILVHVISVREGRNYSGRERKMGGQEKKQTFLDKWKPKLKTKGKERYRWLTKTSHIKVKWECVI